MNKKTLRKKILLSTVPILLILAIILGIISVYAVNRISKTDSKKMMTQLCERETLRFDNKLNLVKHSVDIIYEYAKELQDINGGAFVYSSQYEEQIKEFTIAVANQTEGALAVYFRYNPEITGSGTDGFFWAKQSENGAFEEQVPTDILAYNSNDIEHVGWFYTPKETGESLWMTPYLNKNLDVFMISYIIPLYEKNGNMIGVIGMDIDFKTIIHEAHGIQIYESGSVALVDLEERLIYSSDDKGVVESQKLSNTLYNHITTIHKNNQLLEITDNKGESSVIYCKKLCNGMMMYVNVPKREINRIRDYLIMISSTVSILIVVIALMIILRRIKRIVYPIEKLTEIANQYAEGNWGSQYVSDTGDEVQKLSESIAKMAENTQKYIHSLNMLAVTDAITGVGNKTGYVEKIKEIHENRNHKYDEYAVVACDLNLLKKTNDTYGHEVGDLLIIEAARYICNIFSSDSVFRTGGDEFVILLLGEDYTNRENLLRRFEDGMHYSLAGHDDVKLSISFGMASCPQEQEEYERLFELADDRMYQKKREMKMGRDVSATL